MPHRSLGPPVVIAGIIVAVLGLLIWAGALSWFGRLPGDIRIERDNVRVTLPIVSMIVVSGVLTLLVNLVRRFF